MYNDNVSQSIYLQKLAVLLLLNVKSPVYMNKSCMTMFCRRSYGLKENYSSLSIIPEFEGGGVNNYRTTYYTNQA